MDKKFEVCDLFRFGDVIFKKLTSRSFCMKTDTFRQKKVTVSEIYEIWHNYWAMKKREILDLFDIYSSSCEVTQFCDLEIVQILRMAVTFLSLKIFPWIAYRVAWVVNLKVVSGIWLVLPDQCRLQPAHLVGLAVHQNHLADKIETKHEFGRPQPAQIKIFSIGTEV